MWARVASFEGGDPEELRRRAEEGGMPDMPAGVVGGMVTLTGDKQRRLFISYFDSKESLDAAADHFERMGDEIPEEIRGRRVSVEAYDVVWNSWEEAG
jgi:hypothetical protein